MIREAIAIENTPDPYAYTIGGIRAWAEIELGYGATRKVSEIRRLLAELDKELQRRRENGR